MSTKDPKISISGRVDPKSAAVAAAFLHKTVGVYSRSDLVSACFDAVAHLARQTTDLDDPEEYEEAFVILKRLGLTWEGARASKEQLRALQHDAFSDLEPSQLEELSKFIKNLKGQTKTPKSQPTPSLIKELEAFDEEQKESVK